MATISGTVSQSATEARQSWVPMIAIALGQVPMSFDVASPVVAMGGMVRNALKIGLVIMAGIAMLAIIPARRLPNFIPGEVPDPSPTTAWSKGRQADVG